MSWRSACSQRANVPGSALAHDGDGREGEAGGVQPLEEILPPLIPAAGIGRALRAEQQRSGLHGFAQTQNHVVRATQTQPDGAAQRRRRRPGWGGPE